MHGKKINEYQFANPHVSQGFIGVVLNLARLAQCMYQYGDGHGVVHLEIKDRMKSLLINFIKKRKDLFDTIAHETVLHLF